MIVLTDLMTRFIKATDDILPLLTEGLISNQEENYAYEIDEFLSVYNEIKELLLRKLE